MKGTPRGRVKRILLATGVYHLLLRRRFPGVAVLCYHGIRPPAGTGRAMTLPGLHVEAAELAAHLYLLSTTCQPLDLATFRHLQEEPGAVPPPRPVLLTFDDGYRSLLTLAAPLLARFRVPATIFVNTGPIARGELFWFDALARARGEEAVEAAKALPHRAWEELTVVHRQRVEVEDPNAPLGREELARLAAMPGIAIGGHTAEHPILARAPRAVQAREIGEQRRELAGWLGRPVTAFAYPNGRPGLDYTAETLSLVREAGYDDAFTTAPGFASLGGAGMGTGRPERRREHRRFLMLAGVDGAELAHRLTFSWHRGPS